MLTNEQINSNLSALVIVGQKVAFQATQAAALVGLHYAFFAKGGSRDAVKRACEDALVADGAHKDNAFRYVRRGFAFAATAMKTMPLSASIVAIQAAHGEGDMGKAMSAVASMFAYLNIDCAQHVELWAKSNGGALTTDQKAGDVAKRKSKSPAPTVAALEVALAEAKVSAPVPVLETVAANEVTAEQALDEAQNWVMLLPLEQLEILILFTNDRLATLNAKCEEAEAIKIAA